MKFVVEVMPRPEALDPQGRAVHQSLKRMGFEVADCRVGKTIVVDVKATSVEEGRKLVDKMCKDLLFNPLIETYSVRTT